MYGINKIRAKLGTGINKIRAKLGTLCIICSLGQIKFSLDNFIRRLHLWPFTCPWTSIKFCYFHTTVLTLQLPYR